MIANVTPLPTELAGVQVVVNGVPAPLYSIAFANGEDQISFQVPFETPTGPGAAELQVFDQGDQTADFTADSFTADPGIFVYNGSFAVAVSATTGLLIGPDNPALAGEILVLYTTGLGPLSVDVPDGVPAPSDPLAYTVDPVDVFVDGESSEVFFSGLAPGFVGLYQVNFRVPRDAAPGNRQLQIRMPAADSVLATLPVE